MSRRLWTGGGEEGEESVGGGGFDQSVDVVLSSVVRHRYLEDEGNAQQRLVGVPVGDDLQYREVLEDRVHHVLFRKIFEFVDEVDHVNAHLATIQAVDVATVQVSRTVDRLESRKSVSKRLTPESETGLTSTFSTASLPKEQTLVERQRDMRSADSKCEVTP